MIRFVGVGFILAAITLFSGCGSERREGPVLNVINALNLSVENMKSITARLAEAQQLKKELDEAAEADKKKAKEALDAKIVEVNGAIEELKKQAGKFLEEMRRAERNPVAVTDEEKKELAQKYQGRLVDTLKQLSDERLKLNAAWKSAEAVLDKKNFTDIEQKFKEAESEFENLARLK